jgi:hypothetical protein
MGLGPRCTAKQLKRSMSRRGLAPDRMPAARRLVDELKGHYCSAHYIKRNHAEQRPEVLSMAEIMPVATRV